MPFKSRVHSKQSLHHFTRVRLDTFNCPYSVLGETPWLLFAEACPHELSIIHSEISYLCDVVLFGDPYLTPFTYWVIAFYNVASHLGYRAPSMHVEFSLRVLFVFLQFLLSALSLLCRAPATWYFRWNKMYMSLFIFFFWGGGGGVGGVEGMSSALLVNLDKWKSLFLEFSTLNPWMKTPPQLSSNMYGLAKACQVMASIWKILQLGIFLFRFGWITNFEFFISSCCARFLRFAQHHFAVLLGDVCFL